MTFTISTIEPLLRIIFRFFHYNFDEFGKLYIISAFFRTFPGGLEPLKNALSTQSKRDIGHSNPKQGPKCCSHCVTRLHILIIIRRPTPKFYIVHATEKSFVSCKFFYTLAKSNFDIVENVLYLLIAEPFYTRANFHILTLTIAFCF